jgi:hypothetical protein
MSDTQFESAAKTGLDTMKSEGTTMLRVWQENANRVLRANERMMHGMMSALKLEFQLGQELLEHRMNTMRAATQAGQPAEAGQTVFDRHVQEMERLVATMREVSEEMRASFGDATKMMFHDMDQQTKDLAAAATPEPVAKAMVKVEE